jgi:hypothetical protein
LTCGLALQPASGSSQLLAISYQQEAEEQGEQGEQ